MVTLNKKMYRFKDFKTLRMRVITTTYYDKYTIACTKLKDAIQNDTKPDYEQISALSNDVNLTFNMFINSALVIKNILGREKFIKVNYFDLDQKEVSEFIGSFFVGLTDSTKT